MTKRAQFSASELKRMAQIANSQGVTVELEREGTIARVMPYTGTKIIVAPRSREEEGEKALRKWQADRDKRLKLKAELPDDFAL